MLEIAIMIEGQNGLNWARWQRMAQAVEDLGFCGLYRSDHFTNANPPDLDSLELWVSLTWLASHTRRIRFGPLVSPVSFRQPVMTARIASAIDDLSGGRLILGLGAGWQEREHTLFGWDLLDIPARFTRFEEALQVISLLLKKDEPVNFKGKYYRLNGAVLLPRPHRQSGPPILIGGNGPKRTLPLVVKYAQEWNAVYLPAADISRLNAQLDNLLLAIGRQPSEVRRSMMTCCFYGQDDAQIRQKVSAQTSGKYSLAELRQRGLILGDAQDIVEQLGYLAEAGLQTVMLQWLDLDDLAGLEALAKNVLPSFTS